MTSTLDTHSDYLSLVSLITLLAGAILQEGHVAEQSKNKEGGPLAMNAFEMITLSRGLNLAALFDRRQVQ